MKPPNYTSLPDRFWSKVDEPNENNCWLWTGDSWLGYGKFWYKGSTWRAHRVAATEHYGPIPDGLWVLHHCDVPACVNYKHLYYGTLADNARDAIKRGRTATGERHGQSKLTKKQVLEIRELRKTMGSIQIALMFGVTRGHVWRITSRMMWYSCGWRIAGGYCTFELDHKGPHSRIVAESEPPDA